MKKNSFRLIVLASMFVVNAAYAECAVTLMGKDCDKNEGGTSAHMRGNAVENAHAAKALKAAKKKAKAKAVAIGKASKK